MRRFDILVAGGGIVGFSLALALKRALRGSLDVALVEPRIAASEDRAFAVSAGSRRMFGMLGVWSTVEPDAQPIHRMIITDSRLEDPVRPIFLTFAEDNAPGEPLAHMVAESSILSALRPAAQAAGVTVMEGHVTRTVHEPGAVVVTVSDGTMFRTSLLSACDGARSKLREEAGIGWIFWPYGQSGIVATLGHERDHDGQAEEHFLPSGPFAMLPLIGRRFSMVWTERNERIESLLRRDDRALLDEIEQRAGLKLGPLELLSRPRAYPLGFGLARRFGADRLALVGDAAHLIHPIAGQGLNLGLRDVAALAEIVVGHMSLGLDPGDAWVIETYERARRADTVAMAASCEGLNRLFSNDALPLRLMRDLGLGIVDRLPSVKGRFMAEAAAMNRSLPRLIRGEPLRGF